MITAQMAWRLRLRGLLFAGPKEYETPRLKEIAFRQRELMDEMDALDNELRQMAKSQTQCSERPSG